MKEIEINDPAISWQFARSSGPGGQNVNKSESKAILYFDISKSNTLTPEEKRCLLSTSCEVEANQAMREVQNKITAGGKIIISNQESRSKSTNRDQALIVLNQLLQEALTKKIERKSGMTKKAKSTHKSNIKKTMLIKYKQKRESL